MSTAQPPPSGAFSTAEEEAINRPVEIREGELTSAEAQGENLEELFEIQDTVRHIIDNDYKQVALQFPDELLGVSVPIYTRLKRLLGNDRNVYVLADTTYGSCCVDEVAAAHIDADVVVHYGHACLSPTSRLPVIYVFGKRHIDIDDCVNRFWLAVQDWLSSNTSTKAIIIKTDVSYAYSVDRVKNILQKKFPSLDIIAPSIPKSYTPPPTSSSSAPYAPADPNQPSEPLSPSTIVSISPKTDSKAVASVEESVISYNPQTRLARRETGSVNKLLMRRYALIQKARDADVIGILVGTLGVASYLPLMAHLRRLLSKSQKKCYTISVGKLNPAKLANFMEIECFVLVACPENSVIDSREFYRPIVTPFELEVALGADRSWTGEYVLDFDRVLARQNERGEYFVLSTANIESIGSVGEDNTEERDSDSDEDPDRPSFSLVTGTYRHAKRYTDPRDIATIDKSGSAIALRNNEGGLTQVVANAGSDFLQNRSFQGLEQRLGQDAPATLEQGRSGIAKGYEDVDHTPNS